MEAVKKAVTETRRQLRKIIRASGLSEEELLSGLKEEREKLYKETYGKKRAKGLFKIKGQVFF